MKTLLKLKQLMKLARLRQGSQKHMANNLTEVIH